MINGYVSAMGRKYGVPTPFNDLVVSEDITDIEERAAVERNSATLALFVLPGYNEKRQKGKTYVLPSATTA